MNMAKLWRILERTVFWIVLACGTVWTALAMFVQISPPLLYALWAILLVASVTTCHLRRTTRRWPWLLLVIAAAIVAGWYQTLKPSNDRDWATEVSRNVTARLDGSRAHLDNIRDFDWQTPDTATAKWINDTYDLDQISSLEMATSVWSNPNIAHLLVSFGFQDGRHVVFSAEVRREKTEAFNEIGGFFRQFELALVAATENDIIRLRTHIRGEDVSLYPIDLSPDQMREMFLAYVGLAQTLETKPTFYNTITANCTTVVWRLAHVLAPNLPVKTSLILSGNLPAYMEKLGVLGLTGSLADRKTGAYLDPVKISAKMAQGMTYSQAIRAK